MRTRTRLRMPLKAVGRNVSAANALQGSIKQRAVSGHKICRQALFAHCKTMVPRSHRAPDRRGRWIKIRHRASLPVPRPQAFLH